MSLNKKVVIILLIVYVIVFFSYIDKEGLIWDEYDYLYSSQMQLDLINNYILYSPEKRNDIVFRSIPQHPSLTRWIHGLFFRFVKLYNVEFINFRLGNILFLAVFLTASILFILKYFDYNVLIIYLIIIILNPKFIFFQVFATMDFAVMAIVLMISYAYFLDFKKIKNILFFLVLICIGYAIKLNTIFILFVIFLTSLIFERKKLYIIIPSIIIMFFSLYIFYPFLWINPLRHYKAYLDFHFNHFQNYEYYFGTVYSVDTGLITPWHYPIINFLTKFTEITVIFSIIGSVLLLKKIRKKEIFFILVAAWSQIIVLSKPNTASYNGVRIFLSSFPFIAMIASIGIMEIYKVVLPKLRKYYLSFITVLLLINLSVLYIYYPNYGSYFNLFIGGSKNADRIGMQIDVWGENTSKELLDFINYNMPDNSNIYFIGNHPDIQRYLQRIGLIKENLLFNIPLMPENLNEFDYIVALNNKSLWQDGIYTLLENGENIVFKQKSENGTLLSVILKNNGE